MTDRDPIRILIVDDQELVRHGLGTLLSTFPDIDVVGTAADGVEAVLTAQRLMPDVVLMDIRMPERNGIDATKDITANPLLRKTRVLVLTTFDLDEYAFDALSAGASGFLLKDAEPEEIAEAIRVVHRGDALIQPSVLRRLVEAFAAARPRSGAFATITDEGFRSIVDQLTDREQEILRLVARGLTNEQIGQELFISPATVKTHIARIMAKTSSHDRAQLVVFAYESGLASASR